MKKAYFSFFVFVICIFLFSFVHNKNVDKEDEKKSERRGLFISYIEVSKYLKGKDEMQGKKEIEKMLFNVKKLGFTDVLLQVRAFSDAIYPSSIYPWSEIVTGKEGLSPGYDILEVFLNVAKKYDMRLYAWINPYRIRGDEDSSDISSSNPAYLYLNTDVVDINQGIYFNPAKEESKKIIVDGVLELVKTYSIDGILFDDYFYPNSTIDLKEYEEYQALHPDISIEEFRLEHVNDLIRRVYKVCHQYNVVFGISPDGNIENNYQLHYADVRLWGSKKGYVDYLMPQIYYGFYNEISAFTKVLDEWEKLASDVFLLPVLAFYKVGSVDNYAKSGINEWILNDDIIMREIILSRNLHQYQGFSLFRYDYLFNKELQTSTTMAEIKNMKKILN